MANLRSSISTTRLWGKQNLSPFFIPFSVNVKPVGSDSRCGVVFSEQPSLCQCQSPLSLALPTHHCIRVACFVSLRSVVISLVVN